jgi:SNF2 family DNA or RNA helicase
MAFDYSTVDLEAILQRAYSQMDELQRPGVAKARKWGRCIFDMYMGTGKTFTALTSGLCFKPQRWIIICSKNAINAFQQEVKKWFPEFGSDDLFQIVRGTAGERQQAYKTSALFFATTGASFLRDLDFLVTNHISFDVITIDEADKVGLRNHKGKTYKGIKELTSPKHYLKHRKRVEKLGKWVAGNRDKVSLINICTGTLTRRGIPQMFGYLHLMDPQVFSSYWNFLNTYMLMMDNGFGRTPIRPKNTEGFAIATMPHIHRITEKDAKDVLPPIRRIKLAYELGPRYKDLYQQMAEELYFLISESGGDILQTASSTLAQSIRLRQLLCCPAIIDPALGVGDAIEACADKILEESEDPNFTHNVIFTPFLPSIPIFKEYLSDKLSLPLSAIYTMQGGMEPEEVQEVELAFRKDQKSMVICSTLYAQSFNLETGRNAYHPGFSWDHDQNKQAEGRLRRKTSDTSRTVMSYYCYIPNTVLDDMFDTIVHFEQQVKWTFEDFERIRQSLRRGL